MRAFDYADSLLRKLFSFFTCLSVFMHVNLFVWFSYYFTVCLIVICRFVSLLICQSLRSYGRFVHVNPKRMVSYPEFPVLLSLRWHDEKWLASQTAEQRAQYDLNPFHFQTYRECSPEGYTYFKVKYIIKYWGKVKHAEQKVNFSNLKGLIIKKFWTAVTWRKNGWHLKLQSRELSMISTHFIFKLKGNVYRKSII